MEMKKAKNPDKTKTIKKLIQKLFSNESPGRVLPAPDKIPGKPLNDKEIMTDRF
jgi:hypothetical protein